MGPRAGLDTVAKKIFSTRVEIENRFPVIEAVA
jgi:hypothetical protein